jgi:O-antigen ligase
MFGTAEGKLSDLAARQRYGIGVKWSTAHNTYIQTGAELGVPGVLFYLLFMFGTMRAVARVAKEPSLDPGSDAAMAQAFLASMIAFTVGAFFLSLAYWPFGYILAAIALGLLKTRGSKPVQGQARPRRTPAYSAVQ